MLVLSIGARYLEPEIPPELDQTYRRTFARLKGLFCARGCTPEEAADLAQEAAMRAYMHVQRWGVTGEGLDPLINRIARNLLIDRHRRVAPRLVSLDGYEEVGDPASDPTEEVIRRQRSHEVQTAVGELPFRHQTAIMASMRGMTPAEVGDHLGIGRNAADALLHRARRSLRERLRHVGEGAFGFGLFLRMRAREAGRRLGLLPQLDEAAAASVPAGVAAALAVSMAALSFAAGGAGAVPASARLGSRVAAVRSVGSAAGGSSIGGSGSSFGGGAGGGLLTAGATLSPHHKGANVDTKAPDGQPLLGVGPDVSKYDNGKSNQAAHSGQTAVKRTCTSHRAACSATERTLSVDPRG